MYLHVTKLAAQLKLCVHYFLYSIALLLVLSITAIAFIQNFKDDLVKKEVAASNVGSETNANAMGIVINNRAEVEKGEEEERNLLLGNIQSPNDAEHRIKRDAFDSQINTDTNNNTTTHHQGYYYEEQRPVVVHRETLPLLAERQDNFGPPAAPRFQDAYYESPPVAPAEEYEEEDTQDGGDQQFADEAPNDAYDYGRRHPPGYYDDEPVGEADVEENAGAEDDKSYAGDGYADGDGYAGDGYADGGVRNDGNGERAYNGNVGVGRAAQNPPYESYYRSWYYATPAPVAVEQQKKSDWESGAKPKSTNGERDPYTAYETETLMDDYEYPGAPTTLQKQQYMQQRTQQQQQLQPMRPTYQHQPQNDAQQAATIQKQRRQQQGQKQNEQLAEQAVQESFTTKRPPINQQRPANSRPATTATTTMTTTSENPILSTLKSLKTMWDIYQAFAAAWNMLDRHNRQQQKQQQAEHNKEEEEAAEAESEAVAEAETGALKRRRQQFTQQKKQQQTRINSKKPPKFQTINPDKHEAQRNESETSVENNNGEGRKEAAAENLNVDGGASAAAEDTKLIVEATTEAKRIRQKNNNNNKNNNNSNNNKNNNSKTTKRPTNRKTTKSAAKITTTTTTTTAKSTKASSTEESIEVYEDEVYEDEHDKEKEPVGGNKNGGNKNGGSNNNKALAATKANSATRPINAQGVREKRQMSNNNDNGDNAAAATPQTATDVGEARYIKGDPLKGYYDFVITEGSYKFWAVFQTGTALLIIYSTFAAIYYSKVNPLVTDYDYTDYLGGARALNGGGDADFIDDDDDADDTNNNNNNKKQRHGWFDGIVPRAGRTMKYILDALDKLPVDHREADAAMKAQAEGRTRDAAEIKLSSPSMAADDAKENGGDSGEDGDGDGDGGEYEMASAEYNKHAENGSGGSENGEIITDGSAAEESSARMNEWHTKRSRQVPVYAA